MASTQDQQIASVLETRDPELVLDPNRRKPRCVRHVWADCDLSHFDNREVNPEKGDFNSAYVYQCNNSTCINSFVLPGDKPFKSNDLFQRCTN